MYLDSWHKTAEIAIELKFPTQNLEAKQDNEHFSLRAQGAQDTRRYDFLKDIERLEQVGKKENQNRVCGSLGVMIRPSGNYRDKNGKLCDTFHTLRQRRSTRW